ncbi:MAG: M15 family metallopeptidase [Pseudomonadota bacterium]
MSKTLEKIKGEDLVPMDLFLDDFPIEIELAYACDAAPNIFGTIYKSEGKLILHKDLTKTSLLAARLIHEKHGLHVRFYDGLRTTDAQAKMSEAPIVKNNPHWLEEPNRLLSPPGAGGHPRGMAVDATLQDENGELLDMGTVFDHLAENPERDFNPAHRHYPHTSRAEEKNRNILEDAFADAAKLLKLEIHPLPQEWWDFRMPAYIYEEFEPLSDSDLPPMYQMTEPASDTNIPNPTEEQLQALKAQIIEEINQASST